MTHRSIQEIRADLIDWPFRGLDPNAVADELIAAVRRAASERIRSLKNTQPEHWAGVRIDVAADLISPDYEEK